MEFIYNYKDDYVPMYSNGCIGGNNCRGEIILNFFIERNSLPKCEIYNTNCEGMLERQDSNDSNQLPIIRTVSTGIIMSREQAKEFHDWLGTVLGE